MRLWAALLLVIAPSAVEAQNQKLELSGFVGGLTFTQELGTATNIYQTVTGRATDVDFGQFYGFRAAWSFTRNLAVEGSYSRGRNSYRFDVDDRFVGDVSLGEQFEADQIFWGGSAVVQFPLGGGITPYGLVGVGRLEMQPVHPIADVSDGSVTDVSFGGGLKYWIPSVSWLGLRLDVRYHTASEGITFPLGDASPSGTELTIGGTVRLF